MNKKNIISFISSLLIIIFLVSLCSCQNKIDFLKSTPNEETDELILSSKMLCFDDFGSIILDITKEDFFNYGFKLGDSLDIEIGDKKLNDVPFFNGFYGKYGRTVVVAYPLGEDYYKYIQIAANSCGLKNSVVVSNGESIQIKLANRGKYLEEQEISNIKYSNNRDDYSSDEVFANAREIKAGNLKENTLYRSASPFDNVNNRTKYVSEYLEKVKVQRIFDLSDTNDKIQDKLYNDLPYYSKKLFDEGNVVNSKVNSDYKSDEFMQTIVDNLKLLFSKDGPYLIHCLEGKDRTGYVCMLLEALAGATYNQIVDDYMLTYENYYNITKTDTPEKYEYYKKTKLDDFISYVCEDCENIETANLKKYTEKFIMKYGFSKEDLDNFEKKLCKN